MTHRLRRPLLGCLVVAALAPLSAADDKAKQEYVRKLIPTGITGTYQHGTLVPLLIQGRNAYVVKPTGKVDPQRRWIWILPFWLGVNDGHGVLHHQSYVEQFLDAGFHVAGVDVGTSCGSPAAARLCQVFYERTVKEYRLHRKARLIGQSNGGLIAYAWAFRHPDCVDRVFGIYPATDFRSWPTLPKVVTFPAPGLGYDLSLEELTKRAAEFNPIDNLAPLAKAGVKVLHVHGDRDDLVPLGPNSATFAERYQALHGDAEVVVLKGLGHGGKEFYESRRGVEFLLGD